jgi:hypothetical protein
MTNKAILNHYEGLKKLTETLNEVSGVDVGKGYVHWQFVTDNEKEYQSMMNELIVHFEKIKSFSVAITSKKTFRTFHIEKIK